jgi:hypothetical protein
MNFTFRNNQLTIKGSDFKMQKIIDELYGEGILPHLGKKKSIVKYDNTDINLPQLVDYGQYYSQKIIPKNNSILRGLVNCFYYINHSDKYSVEITNLKAISTLQTNLMNYFKGKIIDWLKENRENNKLLPTFFKNINLNDEFLINLHKSYLTDKYWVFITWCFHKIVDINIYIRDLNNNMLFYFEKGNVYEGSNPTINKKSIQLKVSLNSYNNLPEEIESLYYKV